MGSRGGQGNPKDTKMGPVCLVLVSREVGKSAKFSKNQKYNKFFIENYDVHVFARLLEGIACSERIKNKKE